jgi:hypothetical protein
MFWNIKIHQGDYRGLNLKWKVKARLPVYAEMTFCVEDGRVYKTNDVIVQLNQPKKINTQFAIQTQTPLGVIPITEKPMRLIRLTQSVAAEVCRL